MTATTVTGQTHTVPRIGAAPADPRAWDDQPWASVQPVTVGWWAQRSTDHQPLTQAKVAYDADGLTVVFRVVDDRDTLCRHTDHQTSVCRDSCVEFFVQPDPQRGYFNFELNMGGAMLVWYINDFPADRVELAWPWIERCGITTTHPGARTLSDQVIAWGAAYHVPFDLLEAYMGPLAQCHPEAGVKPAWRANFFKCADASPSNHWGAWSPVTRERLSFHAPECFGTLNFA